MQQQDSQDGGVLGRAAATAGITQTLSQLNTPNTEPYLSIIEQPKARGLRFRYKCEGRSAGAILGEMSTNDNRTYPMIQINNFNGLSAIIVVSCVTKDDPPRPHPHSLVGKDCKEGVCTVKLKGAKTLQFPNLGIQCSTKKEIMENLKNREKIRVDPFGVGYYNNTNSIDLNVVRLAFQCFLPDKQGKYTRIVSPIVSQPIYDKKAVNDLVICRLSCQAGRARGGDEVFMLTEKVNKDDIQVLFYEQTNGQVSWSHYADFGQQDVHRQFAIVFKTPPYKEQNISSPRQVFLQLTRPSDGEVSDPKPFQYTPDDPDPDQIERKRKRKVLNMGNLMTDMNPPQAPAYPPGHLPATLDDEAMEQGDDRSVLKQRIKLRAQRNKNANAANAPTSDASFNAVSPVAVPMSSAAATATTGGTTAMDMFREMSDHTPSGAQYQGGAAVAGGGAGADLSQFTPFLTDNMSLSNINLPSLPSFPITQEQLRGDNGAAAGGDAFIMEQTVAAEEEVVDDQQQQQEQQQPPLIDTISINTQRKIHEAIDALNNYQ